MLVTSKVKGDSSSYGHLTTSGYFVQKGHCSYYNLTMNDNLPPPLSKKPRKVFTTNSSFAPGHRKKLWSPRRFILHPRFNIALTLSIFKIESSPWKRPYHCSVNHFYFLHAWSIISHSEVDSMCYFDEERHPPAFAVSWVQLTFLRSMERVRVCVRVCVRVWWTSS